MPYVLVPVPEEHVQEFTTGLIQLAMGMGGWTDETIGLLIDSLDGRERSLVQLVADAADDRGHLSYREAARRSDIDVGELLSLVTDVNERCRRDWSSTLLMTHTHVDPAGSRAEAVLSIGPVVARRIVLRAKVAADGSQPDDAGASSG